MFVRSASQGVPKIEVRKRRESRNTGSSHQEYWTQHGQKIGMIDSEDARRDRLDLIFRNEPRQIQQKLTALLIRYNATMEYNKKSDMFEVDLLIPFASDEQRREFVRQFLEIRRQKNFMENAHPSSDKVPVQQLQWIGQFNERRKFSFNTGGNFQNQTAKDDKKLMGDQGWINQFPEAFTNEKNLQNDAFDYDANPLESEHSRKMTGQFLQVVQLPPQPQFKPLDFNKVDDIITRRLKNAVFFIKNKEKGFQDNFLSSSENLDKKPKVQQSEVQHREQSIIDQIYSQSANSTDRFKESKFLNNNSYIREDTQPLFTSSRKENFYNAQDYDESYSKQQTNSFIKIAQEPEQDQYEPTYNQKLNQKNKDPKVVSFDDFSKKYEAIKYEQFTKNRPAAKSAAVSSTRSGQGGVNARAKGRGK